MGSVTDKITIERGSRDWKRLRKRCREDLWFLNAKVLGHEEVVPMRLSAHYALCRFAERRTGIPDIDQSRVQLVLVARGWGKALALDTPLPTPSGWTTMGDVLVGDQIIASDGTPTKVVWKSPIQIGNDCYRVAFDDGSEITADAEHLWVVHSSRGKRHLMTTKELSQDISIGSRGDRKWRILNTQPLELSEATLPLDPYLFGIWLGDGATDAARISTVDEAVLDAFTSSGFELGAKDRCTYTILGLRKILREMGVLGRKTVPEIYRRASESQRLSLLQGLMDSDGEADPNCIRARFSNTNHELAEVVYELVVSLGMKARISEKRAQLNGRDCGPVWQVDFRPLLPVFRLKRKLERIEKDVGQISRHQGRMIRSIDKTPSVAVQCLKVDHPSSTFLCDRSMIPTHNTTLVTKGRTIQRLLQNPDWAAGIANERQENAEAFLGMIKAEFETNSFLRALFPERVPDNVRNLTWKSNRIILPGRTRANPVNPSVLAAGIDSTVTGVHMNEWIIDDLLSEKAAENARTGSYSEIEQLNRRVIEMQPLLTSPKKSPITWIGTYWWPGDTYHYIEEVFGHGEPDREFLWNIDLPNGSRQTVVLVQKGELAIFKLKPIHDGQEIYPEKFDRDTLDQLRRDDPVFFASQYLLNPTAGGVAAFKPEYLNEFHWENKNQIRFRDSENEVRFENVRELRTIMSVDPAISKKSTAARSAVTVIGSNGEQLFLLEAWASRVGPHDLAMKILELFQTYRPDRIIIESVAYQMALAEVLTLLAAQNKLGRLPIYEHKSGSQIRKQTRIAGLEPYFRKGLFYYDSRTQTDFFEEYINFSPDVGSRTVDILDAIAFQKEAWDHLQFLGRDRGEPQGHEALRRANERASERIRNHYSRRRRLQEWQR